MEWHGTGTGFAVVPDDAGPSVHATTTQAPVAAPTWSRWAEAPAVVLYRAHLVRTISVALVVGSILFAINQLDVVMAGDATARTWVKTGTTYVVPFFVANYGVLTATHRSRAGKDRRRSRDRHG